MWGAWDLGLRCVLGGILFSGQTDQGGIFEHGRSWAMTSRPGAFLSPDKWEVITIPF